MAAISKAVRRGRSGFQEDEYVPWARVPVLKLYHEPSDVEMDVTFNSVIGERAGPRGREPCPGCVRPEGESLAPVASAPRARALPR